MTRRSSIRYGQLAAAVVTYAAMTELLVVGAHGVDGPDRAAWAGPFGGILTAWFCALAWVLAVLALATWEAVRQLRRRARPGTGGRPVLSLVDVVELAAAERHLAEAWIAAGPSEPLPVDPAAAVRPRPSVDEHTMRSAA